MGAAVTDGNRAPSGLRRQGTASSLRKPAFDLSGMGRAGADFAEHDRILADLASHVVEPRHGPDTGLLAALSVNASAVVRMSVHEDVEDLLRDARTCAAERDYRIALDLLDEYLEGSPAHQEARFLRAFCLYSLGEPRYEEALRVLRPLRDEQTPTELRDRVRELRAELRRLLAPGEYKAYAAAAKRDPEAALRRLGEFLELVPEEGRLAKLLALGHARLGDFGRALEAAELGAAEADTERPQLAQLARRIRLILLQTIAAPAAAAYKAGDPYRARALLARIDQRWRSSGPVRDFERYLALVIEHGNPSVPPAPLLADDRADDLYSLIAELDVQDAVETMIRGGVDQAERQLARLLDAVPGFALLNFVYAICLYRLGRDPERAAACARAAQRDPSLGQARDLLAAIHEWQEGVVLDPVMQEFVAITDTLRGPVTPEQLPALRNRLAELERGIPALRAAVRTDEGRTAVEKLAAAVASWREQVGRANLGIQVADLARRLGGIPAALSGVRTPAEMRAVAERARSIGQEARRLRDSAGGALGSRDRQLLDQIIATTGRLWT
jgi:Tetratricopeptide repeat